MKILVTGAASGIGRATAEYFSECGHEVYGIDIKPIESKKNIECFTADLTSEEDMNRLKSAFEARGLVFDAIISVAGVHAMSSFVEDGFSDMKRLIEINLLGAMLFVNTFHSLLAPRGRVVIVTSEVANLYPMPFNGLYSVSKSALDCYADALGKELILLGQRVITVRPGAVETSLARGSLDSTERLAKRTELYKAESAKFLRITKRFMGKPISPTRVARVLYRAATARRPRAVYSIHRNLGLVLFGKLPPALSRFCIKALLK